MVEKLTAEDIRRVAQALPSTCDYCDGPQDWYTSEGLTLCDRHAQVLREGKVGVPPPPGEVHKVRYNPNVINDWPT